MPVPVVVINPISCKTRSADALLLIYPFQILTVLVGISAVL